MFRARESDRVRSPSSALGIALIGAVGAILALSACGSGSATATDPSAPAQPAYWGAWIGGQLTGEEAPWDMSAVTAFEAEAGKAPSLVEFSSPFADCSDSGCTTEPFKAAAFEDIRRRGAIPFFSWASDSYPVRPEEPEFQLADVIEGKYDSYIREFATAAKNWGHPFFLRFNWEMNADWFPWATDANGNSPAEYVAAWRHVHDIFTAVGADDATWVWCPYAKPDADTRSLDSLYPGDEYVDWTCMDVYNWGTGIDAGHAWRSFSSLAGPTYHEITGSIAPSKPMLIGETASAETGGSKAGWIEELFEALPRDFPQVRGLIWFDKEESGEDWPIGSSPAATEAFAEGIANERYVADSFASLDSSPIPVP
jgi:mannan endo-1,4-beta-mannosidase